MDFLPSTVGEVKLADIPRPVLMVAEALSRRHGEVLLARETGGLHLYMASPKCLEQDGDVELQKRHLAVNIDKYLRLGAWVKRGNYNRERCAYCMKTSTPYRMSALLSWPMLSQRGIHVSKPGVAVQNLARKLFPDEKGNMVPASPGTCIPINQLPPGHPGAQYLLNREYDLDVLWRQFRCSFCVEELKHPEVWYRRLPGGFRDTPQNRIIFFGDIRGVQQVWQARVLDYVDEVQGLKYYLHPYTGEWVACEFKDPETGKFKALPQFGDDDDYKWDISKYKTATGASRMEVVLGFDAAVEWNRHAGLKKTTGILVEGPLDAGRFGPPGMAMIGKVLGDGQASLLASAFRKIIYVGDNDLAGSKAKQSVQAQLGTKVELVLLNLPDMVKDPGLLRPHEAPTFIGPHLFVF